MPIFRSLTGGVIDLAQFAAAKARPRKTAPPYLSAELESQGFDLDELMGRYSVKQMQRLADAMPHIYSNINTIAGQVAAASFHMEDDDPQKDEKHPLEQLVETPNEFFGAPALWGYLIWSLFTDPEGAYWYLWPDRSGGIREIWPVQRNRLTPIKDKNYFIKYYKYQTERRRMNNEKPLKIPANQICRFFFPDPSNMWGNLTPLKAQKLAVNLYGAIMKTQNDLYQEGRLVPLAIVSVDPNIGEPDFNVVRDTIRTDWMEGKRIAVARAGEMDLKSLGISHKEMELVATQELNRDTIDEIYMGIPWRTGEIKENMRYIAEHVIRPIHKLLEAQIQVQVVKRYYDSDRYNARFEDIRKRDRALNIQERNVTWRAKTVNEARAEIGLPPMSEIPGLANVGDLPVQLGNNASFVLAISGFSTTVRTTGNEEPGHMIETQDPEVTTREEAEGGRINAQKAIHMAQQEELKKYRLVCKRAWDRNGTRPEGIDFDTDIIPEEDLLDIRESLRKVRGVEDIEEVFDDYLE